MLFGDVDMSALDAVLQVRPEAFKGVGMVNPVHPQTEVMIAGSMFVTFFSQVPINQILIGANHGAFGDISLNNRDQGSSFDVGNDFGHNIPPTFHHAHDRSLIGQPAISGTDLDLAADVSLVHLDMTRQAGIPVHLAHVLSYFMAHSPSGLVSDPKLSLKLFGRDTMPGGGKQVHGIEPLLEGSVRTIKRRSSHRMNVMTAPRTLIGWYLLHPAELPMLAALQTIQRFAVANLHQVVQTARIVWKLLKEVIDRKGMFFHISPPIPIRYQK